MTREGRGRGGPADAAGQAAVRRGLRRVRDRVRAQRRPAGLRLPGPAAGQGPGRAGGPVLDVAAGSGALGRLLPVAVALDLSAAQLRHNPLGARLQGDAERLPFRDDSFAAAGCAFGINHFPDPAAAVAEMARVAPLVGVLTWARPEPPTVPSRRSWRWWPATPAATAPPPASSSTSSANGSARPPPSGSSWTAPASTPTWPRSPSTSLAGRGRLRRLPPGHRRRRRPGRGPGHRPPRGHRRRRRPPPETLPWTPRLVLGTGARQGG